MYARMHVFTGMCTRMHAACIRAGEEDMHTCMHHAYVRASCGRAGDSSVLQRVQKMLAAIHKRLDADPRFRAA